MKEPGAARTFYDDYLTATQHMEDVATEATGDVLEELRQVG